LVEPAEQTDAAEHEEQKELAGARQLREAHHALAARLLMSLAHLEAEQGRTDYGLRLLDRAEGLAAADDRGVLLSQRGLLLMRTGRARRVRRADRGGAGRASGGPGDRARPPWPAGQS
jgi:hypothetical protein